MSVYDDTIDRMADRIEALEKQLADARTAHGRDTLRQELDWAKDEIVRLHETIKALRETHAKAMAMRDAAVQSRDRAIWQRDEMQSQPRLQRVTPEAMAELEARNATDVLIMSREWLYECSHTTDRGWIRHDDYSNALIPRPARGWFIVRGELPEVT